MTDQPLSIQSQGPPLEDPDALLERSYIEAYLSVKGYSMKDLCRLPEEEARELMIEASRYASNKLAEIETRSKLTRELHGGFKPI